jgi:hypothetical protein
MENLIPLPNPLLISRIARGWHEESTSGFVNDIAESMKCPFERMSCTVISTSPAWWDAPFTRSDERKGKLELLYERLRICGSRLRFLPLNSQMIGRVDHGRHKR